MWHEAMYSLAAGGSRLERQWARRERSVVQVERSARCAALEVRQSARDAGAAREEPAKRARMAREIIVNGYACEELIGGGQTREATDNGRVS